MSNKKKLPIIILKSLEPFVNSTGDKFQVVDPGDNLLHALDCDSTSDFYFKIERYERKPNVGFQFLLDRKPRNDQDNNNYRSWIDIKQLSSQFGSWVDLLHQYDDIASFYDDPILKSNAEWYSSRFELVDDEADTETFNLDQILFLEDYLDSTKEKLIRLKQGQPEKTIKEIEILETESQEIKAALTTEPKKKIIERLSRFWGRAQKTGLEIVKEIFISVAAELTKKLLIEG